jgi:hypothetical protein
MDARLVAVERQLTRGLEDLRAENAALASGVCAARPCAWQGFGAIFRALA